MYLQMDFMYLFWTSRQSMYVATWRRTFKNVNKTRPVFTCLECANHVDITYRLEASHDISYFDVPPALTWSCTVDSNFIVGIIISTLHCRPSQSSASSAPTTLTAPSICSFPYHGFDGDARSSSSSSSRMSIILKL